MSSNPQNPASAGGAAFETPELDAQAESLCIWAAARAGVIVCVPYIGGLSLLANETYLIKKLGHVYGKDLSITAIKDFEGEMFRWLTVGHIGLSFMPRKYAVPLACTGTFAIGMAAQAWIKDGTPKDVQRYKEVFEKAKADADARQAAFHTDKRKHTPFVHDPSSM